MSEARSKALWNRFEALSDGAKAKARERLQAVEQVETLSRGTTRQAAAGVVARELGVSPSTIWNWLALADAEAKADRLAALAPRYAGGTATADCDPRAWDFLKADYLRPEQPSFAACHRRMVEAAAEHGWSPVPSAKTLQRRIEREIPRGARLLARSGRDRAQAVYPHQTRDRSVFAPMQAVNADGHRFDMFVKWPDGEIGRPLMVAVQDLATGMIVGHRIDRTENWSTVRHAFADVVESYGIPEQAWLDNGRGFASKWLTGGMATRYRFKVRDDEPSGILTQLGVRVHWTTPYHGQAKPIERAFRDLCEEISKHPACAGAYTGNNPSTKPANYGSKAVPIERFTELVAAEIRRHNLRPGRKAAVCRGRSFAEVFAAGIADGAIVQRATAAQRRLLLMAAEGVTARRPTGEIHFHGNRYWAGDLVEVMGRRVTVRFDPQDLLAPLAVYDRDGRFLCEAECIEAAGFNDVDAAREHAGRRRRWLKAQREILDLERRMSIDQVADLLPQISPPSAPAPAKVTRLVAGGGRAAAARQAEPDWAEEAFARGVERLQADIVPLNSRPGG